MHTGALKKNQYILTPTFKQNTKLNPIKPLLKTGFIAGAKVDLWASSNLNQPHSALVIA